MKADLTRNTFDPFQHFTRVLMQQGRVQLDADWNEQTAILLHYLRALATDLIGPQGGPTGNFGFEITPISIGPAPGQSVPKDFRISLGHYYVDGILCEADSKSVAFVPTGANAVEVDQWTLDGVEFKANQLVEVFDDAQVPNTNPAFAPTVVQITIADEAKLSLTIQGAPAWGKPSTPKVRRVLTYQTQRDYPLPLPDNGLLAVNDTYLVILDVWERLITYIEDDFIREVALVRPDTATRGQIIWQVKAIVGSLQDHQNPCDQFVPAEPFLFANRGRLKARAKQTSTSTDPCIIPPSASYQGPENQLYRVEIHRAGGAWDDTEKGKASAATFKWSRDNGSAAYAIRSLTPSSGGTTMVALESLGWDDHFGLAKDEWIEIQDDTYVLQDRAETLLQVASVDRPSMTVTLTGVPSSSVGQDPTKHPLLRRWDYQEGDPADGGLQLGSDGAALIVETTGDTWLSLEDGIQIQFQSPDSGQSPNQYRTGDYWLIPARTVTGDVEWPSETEVDSHGNAQIVPLAKPPDGIEHHYAKLAVISLDGGGTVTRLGDCRKKFGPMTV